MSKDVTWVDATPEHQFIGNTLDNQLLTGEDFVRNDGKIFLSIDKKLVECYEIRRFLGRK